MLKRFFKIVIVLTIVLAVPFNTYAEGDNPQVAEPKKWTEVELLKKAMENSSELKILKMNEEVLLLSKENIEELKDMEVNDLVNFQTQNPLRTKSRAEIATEAKLSKYVTPLQFELSVNNSKRQLALKEIEIEKNVKTSIYDYLKSIDEMEKIDLAIERMEESLKNINVQYKNGYVTKLDVEKVSLNLDQMRSQRNLLEKNKDVNKMKLNKIIGQNLNEDILLDKEIIQNEHKDTSSVFNFSNLDKFINLSLSYRPDYLALVENTTILGKINDIYQKNYTYVTNDALATKKQKEIDFLKSKFDLENLENDIKIQVTQQFAYLENLSQQLELQKQFITNANNTLKKANLLYEHGMATNEQVLAEQLQLLEAEQKEIEISYNFKTALAQFELILGTKLDDIKE